MNKLLLITLFSFLLIISCNQEKQKLFTKVDANSSGIFFNNEIIENDSFNIINVEYIFNGGGVGIGDFNNDNKPDIFFSGNQVSNKLYMNKGDLKFEDISKSSGIEAKEKWNTGIAVVDINNDGFLDIYVCAAMLPSLKERENLLFVNQGINENGIPVFHEEAKKYGIADNGNSMNATFFDYDKDGFLDLYVLNNTDVHELPSTYREIIIDGSAPSNDKLYHNNGDGTFTDVSQEAGILIEGYGLGVAVSDLNNDSWPDIYVSNDYLSNDLLYINNGDGTFSNNIQDKIKHQSKFSMGNDIADYNNDGYLDIITLDMLGETNYRLKTTIRENKYNDYILNDKYGYQYQYTRNMLQIGQGIDIPYSEIGLMAGISKTDWSWSPLFADVNNDGFRDLLITNGFPRDITDLDFGDFNFNARRYLNTFQILDSIPVVKIPNYGFLNDKNGLFTDKTKDWGLDTPSFSNGAAFVDLDNDGDLDYVVNNINDPAFIYENNLNDSKKEQISSFIKFQLNGPETNPLGIGTKVVLRFTNDEFQFHEHHLTRGFMSSVDELIHFGISNPDDVESVSILWPDGKFQKIEELKINETRVLDYKDAALIDYKELLFPLKAKNLNPIYQEISSELNVNFIHEEKDIIDYNLQKILPHKLTQNGPCLVSGDINDDGTEDFIIGSSSGYSPEIFFQNTDGTFSNKPLFENDSDKMYEEESMALFDLENDGDLDLYLVSGSNEFVESQSEYYTDRLFINDGTGTFSLSKVSSPTIKASGSMVKAADFDNDGFTDLFVASRTPFGKYPSTEQSYLLKNDNGVLKDVTSTFCSELVRPGMVTDFSWSDVNNDGLKDLILVGEFMPITIFQNNKTSFTKMENTGLENINGWWESIISEDFDNDGDLDFVAGNLGGNNFYQPSQNKPTNLIAKDFDNNGTVDPILFTYMRTNYSDEKYNSHPVNFWGDLYGQSPLFRSRYNSFKNYAKITENNFLSPEELKDSRKLTFNYDKTVYIENMGNGKFELHELPLEVQIAPINSLVINDFNEDGFKDVLLVGNNFGNEVFIGRYDAFNGGLLENDGKGGFKFIPTEKSGFLVQGDAKSIIPIKSAKGEKPYFVVTQNRGPIKVFQSKK